MILNLYIENGCFIKHPFINRLNSCLGFQVGICLDDTSHSGCTPWFQVFDVKGKLPSKTSESSIFCRQPWLVLGKKFMEIICNGCFPGGSLFIFNIHNLPLQLRKISTSYTLAHTLGKRKQTLLSWPIGIKIFCLHRALWLGYDYLDPICPLFLSFNPPKQGLFQSKQGSFGFQVQDRLNLVSKSLNSL